MKKIILALVFVLTVTFAFAGCESKEPRTLDEAIDMGKDTINQLTQKADEKEAKREALLEKNKVGLKNNIVYEGENIALKIDAYSVIPWETLGVKEQIVYFYVEYTNLSEYDSNLPTLVNFCAYQDGIKLTEALYFDDDDTQQIRPGKTRKRKCAFSLRDTTTDVEIVLDEYNSGFDGEYIVKIK